MDVASYLLSSGELCQNTPDCRELENEHDSGRGDSPGASIVQGVRSLSGVEVVLCPPFISLAAAKEATKGSPVGVGAQNMYFEEKGAFTGETSPIMLKDLCAYVILGHSERRSLFRETDDAVGRKVAVAVANELKPILCVGETAHERQSQRAEGVVTAQIRDG